MLSKVSEKKIRWVQMVLALSWLMLIGSLLTTPGLGELNRNGSFRFYSERTKELNPEYLHFANYIFSLEIFWTMMVSIFPIALMLFGHEAWRRICPLSFFSQIPRYLNKNYYRSVVNPQTDLKEKKLNLIRQNSWLHKNHWYVQFWLLFAGLCCRVFFTNADRVVLAILFLIIIGAALTIGYFFGGKTWCNYICPLSIVQKIYTEPGGIFESKAHIDKLPISQSMCRESTSYGDISACVSCISDCPDIDLESSYWRGIENSSRRFVYFACMGLVLGFYGYYLFLGTWDYSIFSAWLYETISEETLFKSGRIIQDEFAAFSFKWFTVLFGLAAFVFSGYGLGLLAERGYRFYRNKFNKPIHNKDLLNQVFSMCAFITVNFYYVFGGFSGFMQIPDTLRVVAGILVVLISSAWLNMALCRRYGDYQRESVVNSLLKQLKKLNVNFSEILEGNSLDNLNYDEIYILGKTLPGVTRDQKLTVYKQMLDESLHNGTCNSSDSLVLMADIRHAMGVSDEEHGMTLHELGIEDVNLFDPDKVMIHEARIREKNYQDELRYLINEAVDHNISINDFIVQNDAKLMRLQALYNIDESTHAAIMSDMLGDHRFHIDKAGLLMEKVVLLTRQIFSLEQHRSHSEDPQAGYCALISNALIAHRRRYVKHLLSLLELLAHCPEGIIFATNLHFLLGNELNQVMVSDDWNKRFEPEILSVLQGGGLINNSILTAWQQDDRSDVPFVLQQQSSASIEGQAPDIESLLKSLLEFEDVLISAYVLLILSLINLAEARKCARLNAAKFAGMHWLAQEIWQLMMSESLPEPLAVNQLTVTLSIGTKVSQCFTFAKPVLRFGRDLSNDIVISSPNIASFQGCFKKITNGQVAIELFEKLNSFLINHQAPQESDILVAHGDELQLTPGISMMIAWDRNNFSLDYVVQRYPAFEKVLWLTATSIFKGLDLYTLAEIVQNQEVRLYRKGAYICKQYEFSRGAYILHSGIAEVVITGKDGNEAVVNQLRSGEVIGELSIIRGATHAASVRVTSPDAIVMLIDRRMFSNLMDNNSQVARAMLNKIAGYLDADES